jgi:ribosomal protein S19
MFHVRFEYRNKISTNRYSIPGFPALYLGESTYVCWEELNRSRLRDLWFSRIENTEELNVIKIQRFEDLLEEIEQISNEDDKLSHLCRYMIIYPLIIACTIKVKDQKSNFTPQYIVPQLLLQYIAQFKNADERIDGIMYLSSQVDYSKVNGVRAYNYVFPVKASLKGGFCKQLSKIFHISEPTSLEIEEIIHNPLYPGVYARDDEATASIELANGIKSTYLTMSFGRLEQSLALKPVTVVIETD